MFSVVTVCEWIALIAVFGLYGIIVHYTIRAIRRDHLATRLREAEKIRRTVEQKYARKLREDRRRAKRGER